MTEFVSDRTSSNQARRDADEQPGRLRRRRGDARQEGRHDPRAAVDDPRRRHQQDRLRLRGDRRGARLGRLRQRRLRGDHVDPLRAHGRPRRPRPDVRQPRGRGRVHRLRPPAVEWRTERMYEKDGEKYFIVDSHLHFWDASPANWVKGARGVRQGLDRVLPRLPGPGPAGDALVDRALPEVLGRRLREGRLRRRPRRQGASSSRRT